jgi:hypothetical protein
MERHAGADEIPKNHRIGQRAPAPGAILGRRAEEAKERRFGIAEASDAHGALPTMRTSASCPAAGIGCRIALFLLPNNRRSAASCPGRRFRFGSGGPVPSQYSQVLPAVASFPPESEMPRLPAAPASAPGPNCVGMDYLAAIQAAISDASQPEHPGDSCRRLGNLPFRSNRQRVERLRPVRRQHSGSRMIASIAIGDCARSG